MAILKRFGDIMRANINALLDKAEDPGKMVDQMLLDLNEDLAAVKKETASVMAAATSARQQVDECKANIAKYEAAAKSAVKAGNDDDARKLLSTKQQYESTLTSLEEAAKVAEDNAAKMRQMHDKLVSDINGLQARRAAIHAKVSVANAQQHVNAATEKTSRTSRSTAAFDRMEEKADRMLNEANATAELNTQATNEDIANKYLSGGSASVEDELARLKAEVGVEEQQQAEQEIEYEDRNALQHGGRRHRENQNHEARQRIAPDERIFAKVPQLRRGQYYFSMANLLKNKNFPWVLRSARNKPDTVCAIAGGGSLAAEAKRLGLADLPNVVYLGYVSDGEAKALMHHCKAFLFPTLYEGFGIPPLEAVACGAPRIYVSDTPCMREVYGDCAGYIDLKTNHGYVDDVTRPKRDAAELLARYSWHKSAQALLDVLTQTAN